MSSSRSIVLLRRAAMMQQQHRGPSLHHQRRRLQLFPRVAPPSPLPKQHQHEALGSVSLLKWEDQRDTVNNNSNKNHDKTDDPQHTMFGSVSWARPPYLWASSTASATTTTTTTTTTITDPFTTWFTHKIPRGFEHFFPKQGPAKPEDAAAASTSKKENESQKSGSTTPEGERMQFGSGKGGGGSGDDNDTDKKKKKKQANPPPPPQFDDSQSTPGMIAMLLLVLLLRSVTESDKHGIQNAQKEVTFAEFRRAYLAKGRVDRVEIVNKTVAKVYLKPAAATIMAEETSAAAATATTSSDMMDFTHAHGSGSTEITDASLLHNNTNSQHHNEPFVYFFIGSVETLEEKLAKAQQEWHPADWIEVMYVTHTNWALEAVKLLPLLAMMASLWYGSKLLTNMVGGGRSGFGGSGDKGGNNKSIFGIGKSTAKKISPADVDTTFADVAGCQQAKMEVMEFVDFLQHPARFQKLGAKIPKGALLCGPPGTGKTLLAKAVAGEAGVPFYSISGSDFIEMFVGVGPSRVRDLFKEARQNSPCIIFIDEIDAVGRQRGRGGFSGGNDERENTLNQLLVEMDGFSSSTNVVVLAGTNRPDILDQALTRPGRFDRQITVDKPDLQGRKEIFLVHLKGIKLQGDKSEYAGRLAGLTPGFAGADIANLVNEAAIVAARRKATSVTIQDFEKATDRIIGGLESNKIMSDSEKSIVAHHEAGHAVAGWFLEHADPLLKVTIIPRSSGALGFAQYLPKEVFLRSRDQIMDIVCMALAGRAAEQVFFGDVTTGASDDLRRVTQLVYSTIKVFGMNPRLGQLAFPDNENQNPGDKKYSESTAEAMDEEARSIVNEAYQRTLNLIQEHKDDVARVAQLLRDKETITHDDIVDLIGKRPYGDKAYEEYISSKAAITNIPGEEEEPEEDDSTNEDDTSNTTLTPGLA